MELDISEPIKNFEEPTQVKFYEDENDEPCYGIAFSDKIICSCCGGIFYTDEVINIKPLHWVSFKDAIEE